MSDYKVSYKNLGKVRETDNSPRVFVPTKIFIGLFAILLFGCSFISMMGISFTSLFSMTESTIEIGFPFSFLEIKGLDQTNLLIGGLIFDLLIYAIVSYVINIIINLIKGSLTKNPNELAKEIKVSKEI